MNNAAADVPTSLDKKDCTVQCAHAVDLCSAPARRNKQHELVAPRCRGGGSITCIDVLRSESADTFCEERVCWMQAASEAEDFNVAA